MSINDAYQGFKKEVTYGTAEVVTKFFPLLENSVEGVYDEKVVSQGLKAGMYTQDGTRVYPNPKGAEGDITLDVNSKGFIFWLEQIFGSATLDVSATAGLYDHTFTFGSLPSFTQQINKPSDTGDNIFTHAGGVVTEAEFTAEVDEILKLTVSCDFKTETPVVGAGAFAKQTPSYPSGNQDLVYTGGSVLIGGVAAYVSELSVKINNELKTDSYTVGGTKLKPQQNGYRSVEFSFKLQYQDATHTARVAAALAADAQAAVVLTFEAPVAEGGGGKAKLVLSMPHLDFTEASVPWGGFEVLEQDVKGMAYSTAADKAITATYSTPDAS